MLSFLDFPCLLPIYLFLFCVLYTFFSTSLCLSFYIIILFSFPLSPAHYLSPSVLFVSFSEIVFLPSFEITFFLSFPLSLSPKSSFFFRLKLSPSSPSLYLHSNYLFPLLFLVFRTISPLCVHLIATRIYHCT